MEFHKYINFNTARIKQSQQSTTKLSLNTQSNKPRVIKFVGNMEQNIKQILQGINCHCGNKKQFYNIMIVFANKIQKLRKQREHYKNTLKQYLITMNNNNNSGQSLKQNSSNQQKKQIQVQTLPVKISAISQAKQQKRQPLSQLKSTPNNNKLYYQENKENKSVSSKNNNINSYSNKRQNCQNPKSAKKSSNNIKNKENQEIRNNYTAIKNSSKNNGSTFGNDVSPLKQIKSQDKRKKRFYQDQIHPLQHIESSKFDLSDDNNTMILSSFRKNQPQAQQFSLNLSSFQDGQRSDICRKEQQQCSQFMKQVSGIMSQTNLLQSDEQQQLLSKISDNKKQQKSRSSNSNSKRQSSSKNKSKETSKQNFSQLQQKILKLKMLKQSTNLIQFANTTPVKSIKGNFILQTSSFAKDASKFSDTNGDLFQIIKKKSSSTISPMMMTKSKSQKAQAYQSKNYENQKDKQNIIYQKFNTNTKHSKPNKQNRAQKVQSCLKQYNISLQKLQQFIQNKQYLKQLQKTQDFQQNLKNIKSFSSCTLNKNDRLSKQQNYPIIKNGKQQYEIIKTQADHFFNFVIKNNNNSSNKKAVQALGERNMNY